MKLRCWPGCLARVDYAEAKGSIGAIVTALRPSKEWIGFWVVASPRSLQVMKFFAATDRYVEVVASPNAEVLIPDRFLTPIVPPPGTKIDEEELVMNS